MSKFVTPSMSKYVTPLTNNNAQLSTNASVTKSVITKLDMVELLLLNLVMEHNLLQLDMDLLHLSVAKNVKTFQDLSLIHI